MALRVAPSTWLGIVSAVSLAAGCTSDSEAEGDAGGARPAGVTAGAGGGDASQGSGQGTSGQGTSGQGGSGQGSSGQQGSGSGGAGPGGTGGGGGDACGNGVCDPGEDCLGCAVDCGACPRPEVLVEGGDCDALQGGLDRAAAVGLPLRLTSTFTVTCTVRIPSNVTVDAQAATFTFTKPGRIRNHLDGGGGAYTHAGGFVWDGGTFVGAGNGIFTISHSPGFTIRNTVQYAYADAGDDGHSIEVNSSGGPHTPDVYTVQITGNTFLGVTGQRANSNDEPVQYDFAWDGSGGDAPFDATMTHNLRVAGNTFHRLDETGTWQFGLCAIGAHRGGAGEPAERHNGILIENNLIHGAVGATENISPNKGAIALWNARDVWIRDNEFFGCTGSRLVSAWDANADRDLNDATMNINISGNVHDGAPVTITMPASNTTGG